MKSLKKGVVGAECCLFDDGVGGVGDVGDVGCVGDVGGELICPKADQPHQKGMYWSHCSMTEQWCLLVHLRYMVGLYHLTINSCQHH